MRAVGRSVVSLPGLSTVGTVRQRSTRMPVIQGTLVLTAEVKYSFRKIALKTARDGEKNMTHDSVNIFFKLLLKHLLEILHFGTNYGHRIVHIYFFYK